MKQKIKFGLSMLLAAFMTMALILPAAQAAVVVNEKVPVSFLVTNACTGDIISVSGTLHVSLALTDDCAGGFHVKEHSNIQDSSAVGLPSGLNYRWINTRNFEFNVKKGMETTLTVNSKLISQGSAPDINGRLVAHITINPDGTTTVEFIKGDIDCQGTVPQ